MKILTHILRYTWVTAWYLLAISVVLVAAVFSAVRLALPFAEEYRTLLETELSDYLGQPARFEQLDAEWRGLAPSVVLKGVSLLAEDGTRPVLEFEQLRLGLDLPRSLRRQMPVFSHITLVGVELGLTKFKDGHVSLAGLTPGGGGEQVKLDALAAWLFAQGELSLENSDITWIDERLARPRPLRLVDVNAQLRNRGEHHWLDVSMAMPEHAGRALRFALDIEGDPLTTAMGRRSRLYLSAQQVNLAELYSAVPIGAIEVEVGNADFQLWMDWQDGVLQQVQGDVDLRSLSLVHPDDAARQTHVVQRLGGRFHWWQQDAGWRFEGDNVVFSQGRGAWPPSRVALKYRQGEAAPQLEADAGFLRLDGLAELLTLADIDAPKLREAVQALEPRGEVHDAHLSWRGGADGGYRAYARVENLAVQAWHQVPAVTRAAGQLWLDEGGGQVSLSHAAAELALPTLFRWPLVVDSLSGQAAWRMSEAGWRLSARDLRADNGDIHTRSTLDMWQGATEVSPFLSLVTQFGDGDGSTVSRYLPVGIMGPNTVAWLDRAIVGARVTTGGVLLHGRLKDFPFDAGNGRFEVRFDLEGGELDYTPGWPKITDLAAEVLFEGRSMLVTGRRGKILQSDIRWAKAEFEDMTATPLVLKVQGEMTGRTQETLDYLQTSPPLQRKFGRYLDILHTKGDSLLNLDLKLPVMRTEDSEVRGWLRLDDNTLSVSPLGEILRHATGTIHFSGAGLNADDLRVDLLGQPSRLSIASSEARRVRLHALGRFDAADLASRYLPAVSNLLTGGSEWDVTLDIPMEAGQGGEKPTVLWVKSAMQGIEARLPPPLRKRAEEQTLLQLRVDLPPQGTPLLHLAYGGFVSGIFELSEGATGEFKRGELRLSTGEATLPEAAGLRLIGWLDRFSLDDWRSVLGLGGDDSDVSWLQSADLAVRVAEIYGQELHNLKLSITPKVRHWLVKVGSKELQGDVRMPFRSNRDHTLDMVLDFCRLDGFSMGEGEAQTDPREIPPLRVTIGDLQYQKRRFGSLKLETERVANGMQVKEMVLSPRATTMKATGGWYVDGAQQRSTLELQVESSDIERTMEALDYVSSIAGGKGSLQASLQWPGAFTEVDLGRLRGKLSMDLRNGQLVDVEPGAGRLFGLLSLQTLPRRLLLDFSDVFRKGFGFDRIQGDFRVEDGDAYTNNLYLEGPAARVEITGRTGLVVQDYDQLVTVTPHVSETLPLIGALALTPQVGAAILFVQKLLEPQINKAARKQYSITGPWVAPKIKKIGQPAKAARPDEAQG